MNQGCVISMTQGHTSKVKVTVHTYPESVFGPYLFTAMLDLDNISHNCCLWPKGVSWLWPKVISLRSRLHCIHTLKWCLGLNSSLPCSILIIFYTIVFPDPRVRHDLARMLYLKGQGHSTLIANICFRSITDYCHVWCSWYLTHLYCDLHSGSYCQGQGHSSHIAKICFWAW